MASALFLLLLLAGAVLSGPPEVEFGGRGEEAEPVSVVAPGGWNLMPADYDPVTECSLPSEPGIDK